MMNTTKLTPMLQKCLPKKKQNVTRKQEKKKEEEGTFCNSFYEVSITWIPKPKKSPEKKTRDQYAL